MGWKVHFQYKPKEHARPYDEIQDDSEIEISEALPNVGDTVAYMEDDKIVARKVVSRHFSFGYPSRPHIRDPSLSEISRRKGLPRQNGTPPRRIDPHQAQHIARKRAFADRAQWFDDVQLRGL